MNYLLAAFFFFYVIHIMNKFSTGVGTGEGIKALVASVLCLFFLFLAVFG